MQVDPFVMILCQNFWPLHSIQLLLIIGPLFVFMAYFLKYYSSKWFSNIYDVMQELFHIVVGLILVIILENVVTNLVPLNALSVFLDDSLLKIPLYGFTFLMHAIIISMIILGVCSVQIQNDATLVLVSLSILIVEVLDVLRVCLRFWAPLENLDYSLTADVLYISCKFENIILFEV